MYDYNKTHTIDLSDYFKKYSVINPAIQLPEIQISQLYNYKSIADKIDISEYTTDYILSTNDRPDTLSMKLYDTQNYWWVNMSINDMSYYDFPLSDSSINTLANYLYTTERAFSLATYIKYIEIENNTKRNIKIIESDKLLNFLTDYNRTVNEL